MEQKRFLMLLPVKVTKRREAKSTVSDSNEQTTSNRAEKRPRFQDSEDNLFSRMERYAVKTEQPTVDNRPGMTATRQTTPISGPAVAKTFKPLKPTTSKAAAVDVKPQAAVSQAATTQQLAEVRSQAATSQTATTQQLEQVRRHLQEMNGKLRQLTGSPTKTQWTLLSTSVELLSARQEIMMTDLHAIREQLEPRNNNENGDTDNDSDNDDIWGTITPDEEDPCYEGAALWQCRHDNELRS